MLSKMQTLVLVLLSLALWVVATAYIRFLPEAFLDPVKGAVGFATSVPMAVISVLIVRRVAGLGRDLLLPGIAVVGAVAMMIDGAVLRWIPDVYGTDAAAVRLGAAWLLWGYGLSLAFALLLSLRRGYP